MNILKAIKQFKETLQEYEIQPEIGLGNDLFLFTSTLTPIVNVDLLVINKNKQILLSWRNDDHCGAGWHIPGGCIRLKEKIEDRIQKTAEYELGTNIIYDAGPIKVFEIFTNEYRENIIDQRERCHFITLVYRCKIPDDYDIELHNELPNIPGHLKWFDSLPDNLVDAQQCYRSCWEDIIN